jgi:hypothetical protein
MDTEREGKKKRKGGGKKNKRDENECWWSQISGAGERKEKKERKMDRIFDVPERIRNRGGEGAIVF